VLRRLLRSLLGLTPTLDLHGFGVKDAVAACERFLAAASAEGEREVRIVYGKGRGTPGGIGVLRAVVPRWLENDGAKWVERFERDLDPSGDDGAVRVWLRPANAGEHPPSR
jgi:DNA-nicking Smr family endonuclease